MRDAILSKLSRLKGEPLSDLWRGGFQIFEFGMQKPAKNKKGEDITEGDFSIHVSGVWLIKHKNKTILDGRNPTGTSEGKVAADDFFLRVSNGSLLVVELDASDQGSVTFELTGGYTLHIESHPDNAKDEEIWRLIEVKTGKPFVVSF